mmetsp:Transcript_23508/g.75259  ORF Transcript_23508/g.75259 Transcript_23508/m.75259 type:complete len:425 (+) Transcript_23508:1834-3108(+)
MTITAAPSPQHHRFLCAASAPDGLTRAGHGRIAHLLVPADQLLDEAMQLGVLRLRLRLLALRLGLCALGGESEPARVRGVVGRARDLVVAELLGQRDKEQARMLARDARVARSCGCEDIHLLRIPEGRAQLPQSEQRVLHLQQPAERAGALKRGGRRRDGKLDVRAQPAAAHGESQRGGRVARAVAQHTHAAHAERAVGVGRHGDVRQSEVGAGLEGVILEGGHVVALIGLQPRKQHLRRGAAHERCQLVRLAQRRAGGAELPCDPPQNREVGVACLGRQRHVQGQLGAPRPGELRGGLQVVERVGDEHGGGTGRPVLIGGGRLGDERIKEPQVGAAVVPERGEGRLCLGERRAARGAPRRNAGEGPERVDTAATQLAVCGVKGVEQRQRMLRAAGGTERAVDKEADVRSAACRAGWRAAWRAG